eukprot:362388-Chlamydomonas_euryale.AAC.6
MANHCEEAFTGGMRARCWTNAAWSVGSILFPKVYSTAIEPAAAAGPAAGCCSLYGASNNHRTHKVQLETISCIPRKVGIQTLGG